MTFPNAGMHAESQMVSYLVSVATEGARTDTPAHLLQLGLGEIGHGEEPERIVPRQAAISVFDPFA